MDSESLWRLAATSATSVSAGLTCVVDLRNPGSGARIMLPNGREAGSLWRRTNPLGQRPLEETYTRGADLVATYAPGEAFPFREEFYWRLADAPPTAALLAEVTGLVSLQTELLDTEPHLTIESEWQSDESITLAGAAAVLHRLTDAPYSAVETVDPTDIGSGPTVMSATGSVLVCWTLHCPFLEKGVIRRARLGFALVPREGDVEAAQQWLERFAQQPVALTA